MLLSVTTAAIRVAAIQRSMKATKKAEFLARWYPSRVSMAQTAAMTEVMKSMRI